MELVQREFYTQPPRFEAVEKALVTLRDTGDFVKLFPVGKSVLRRKIYAVGIGDLRNATLFAGAFHGQEWLTCLLLIRYFEALCRAYEAGEPLAGIDVRRVLGERGLLCVPLVNPDGVEIALGGPQTARHFEGYVRRIMQESDRTWQANVHGVDLNHNFDAGFEELQKMERASGITGPSPRQYGGRHPMSEPETKAIAGLCTAFDVKKVFAFHAQGEEIFYRYGPHTPPNARLMGEMLAHACGYKLIEPEGMASHGGFKDWFIEKFARPGFTIEIGRGENPLPIEELEPIYARLLEMMTLAMAF